MHVFHAPPPPLGGRGGVRSCLTVVLHGEGVKKSAEMPCAILEEPLSSSGLILFHDKMQKTYHIECLII